MRRQHYAEAYKVEVRPYLQIKEIPVVDCVEGLFIVTKILTSGLVGFIVGTLIHRWWL